MKRVPVSTAYGVLVGVGAIGTVVLGIMLLGEPANAERMISDALVLAGIRAQGLTLVHLFYVSMYLNMSLKGTRQESGG